HQDVPFEQGVEAVRPARDLSRQPLFQVMFALQTAPTFTAEISGVTTTALDVEAGTSKFDLTLSLAENADGVEGALEYATDLFEPESMRRFASHYERLLRSALHDPERPLSTLELEDGGERARILHDWSGAAVAGPLEAPGADRGVPERILERVRERPDAIALA